jgi:hypothetical protein
MDDNGPFAKANDFGTEWSADANWSTTLGGTAMRFTDEKPQACEMYTVKAEGELNAAFTKAHDGLFYKATGLSDFGDKEELDQNDLEELYGEEMARKVLDGELFTTRPALRKQLMYLLYFGVGGGSLTGTSTHIKTHLNGRKAGAGSTRDVALNHFVAKPKVVRTCIFEVGFGHNAGKIEQAGIEFVTTTDKHTNVRRSNGAIQNTMSNTCTTT